VLAELDLKATAIRAECKRQLGTSEPNLQPTPQPGVGTRKSVRVQEKAAAVATPETNDDDASQSDDSQYNPDDSGMEDSD
jgi:hypothetical protein